MYELILIFHVIIACGLIGLVLIQQGKGAEVGAAFGSGASQTIFGSQGSGNFITRTTAVLATLFFTTSLSLSYLASIESKRQAALSLPEGSGSQANHAPLTEIPDAGKNPSEHK